MLNVMSIVWVQKVHLVLVLIKQIPYRNKFIKHGWETIW